MDLYYNKTCRLTADSPLRVLNFPDDIGVITLRAEELIWARQRGSWHKTWLLTDIIPSYWEEFDVSEFGIVWRSRCTALTNNRFSMHIESPQVSLGNIFLGVPDATWYGFGSYTLPSFWVDDYVKPTVAEFSVDFQDLKLKNDRGVLINLGSIKQPKFTLNGTPLANNSRKLLSSGDSLGIAQESQEIGYVKADSSRYYRLSFDYYYNNGDPYATFETDMDRGDPTITLVEGVGHIYYN